MLKLQKPQKIVQNVNAGWDVIQGFIWPFFTISIIESVVILIIPQLALIASLPLLLAYTLWISIQYHIGRQREFIERI